IAFLRSFPSRIIRVGTPSIGEITAHLEKRILPRVWEKRTKMRPVATAVNSRPVKDSHATIRLAMRVTGNMVREPVDEIDWALEKNVHKNVEAFAAPTTTL